MQASRALRSLIGLSAVIGYVCAVMYGVNSLDALVGWKREFLGIFLFYFIILTAYPVTILACAYIAEDRHD